MRRLGLALVLALAVPAEAKPVRRRALLPTAEQDTIWREIIEPHGAEVRPIVALALQHTMQGDVALYGDYDPSGAQRQRYYQAAFGMLRYARHRAPANLEVLRAYGATADELGKTRDAIDAFETAVRLVGPEKAGAEVTGRLGALYLRLGRLDDAIHYLRFAQGQLIGRPAVAIAVVHLANALAARGDMGEALETLRGAMPQDVPYYSNELALAAFSLAVLYDRDEQTSAALEVLDHMQGQLTTSFGATVQNALATMRFAPAEDQHYDRGLLYEVLGNYAEARVEWSLYAAADLPFSARARDHIAAIDARKTRRHP